MHGRDDVVEFKQQLRDSVTAAMKARDKTALRALRSALAAVENAEAVHAPEPTGTVSRHVAGAVTGLGAADVERRALTLAEAAAIVTAEARTLQVAADEYELHGETEAANQLRAEAAVLLGPAGSPPRDHPM